MAAAGLYGLTSSEKKIVWKEKFAKGLFLMNLIQVKILFPSVSCYHAVIMLSEGML